MSRAAVSCAASWPAACAPAGPRRRPAAPAASTGGQIKDMVMISERPAEADDRAVPGHWEGDLIIGKDCQSAVGTLVERTTRYVLLLHLPAGPAPRTVSRPCARRSPRLPAELARTITWDQGRRWPTTPTSPSPPASRSTSATRTPPGSAARNENTNGLLRQYLPKGTDLSVHTAADLDRIAAQPQRPPPQDPRLAQPRPSPQPATVPPRPRCNDRLNPPPPKS